MTVINVAITKDFAPAIFSKNRHLQQVPILQRIWVAEKLAILALPDTLIKMQTKNAIKIVLPIMLTQRINQLKPVGNAADLALMPPENTGIVSVKTDMNWLTANVKLN